MVTMKVDGLDVILKRLDQKPARVQQAVSTVIARYALLIEASAKKAAPVDTGNLRASIRTELEALSAVIISGADYSAYVEFGTSRMRAQPFMFPALEQHRNNFIQDLRKAIGDA